MPCRQPAPKLSCETAAGYISAPPKDSEQIDQEKPIGDRRTEPIGQSVPAENEAFETTSINFHFSIAHIELAERTDHRMDEMLIEEVRPDHPLIEGGDDETQSDE